MVDLKIIAGILLAVLMTGCQTPSPTSNATIAGADLSQEKPAKYFLAERQAAISSIKSQAASQCKNAGQQPAVEQCFRKVIFESFGSPSVGKGCPTESGLSDYANCITASAVAEQLEQKLGPADRFEPTAEDLRSPKDYLLKVMNHIKSEAEHACSQKSVSERDRCERDVVKRLIELPENFSATCERLNNLDDNGECLGQGMRTEMIEKAAKRLNNKLGS